MILNQERSYRQSSFCQICQNNFDYDRHLSTTICKSNHVICSTCAGQIVRKDPRCPFCRDDILHEVRSKYEVREVDVRDQYYLRLMDDYNHGINRRPRFSRNCALVCLIVVFFLLGTGCLIGFLNLRSCSNWGDYNVTCYTFDNFYCCQRDDGTCPNNYRECDNLFGQNLVLSILEYGTIIFYGVGFRGLWQLAKR